MMTANAIPAFAPDDSPPEPVASVSEPDVAATEVGETSSLEVAGDPADAVGSLVLGPVDVLRALVNAEPDVGVAFDLINAVAD
jgi:hypothetical protein